MFRSEELLPCPFCGSKPKKQHLVNAAYVLCASCDMQVTARAESMEKAMSLWNERFKVTPVSKPTPYATKTDVSNPYEVGRDYSFVLIGQITFDGSILQAFDEEIILRESLSRNTIIIRRDKILWARAM